MNAKYFSSPELAVLAAFPKPPASHVSRADYNACAEDDLPIYVFVDGVGGSVDSIVAAGGGVAGKGQSADGTYLATRYHYSWSATPQIKRLNDGPVAAPGDEITMRGKLCSIGGDGTVAPAPTPAPALALNHARAHTLTGTLTQSYACPTLLPHTHKRAQPQWQRISLWFNASGWGTPRASSCHPTAPDTLANRAWTGEMAYPGKTETEHPRTRHTHTTPAQS